jgi:hypothetical protein
MFLQVVIKSMREASPGDELFGGQESKMYQDMLDQQWAQVMTEGGGTGLARVMERQLAANAGSADTSKPIDLKPCPMPDCSPDRPFSRRRQGMPLSGSPCRPERQILWHPPSPVWRPISRRLRVRAHRPRTCVRRARVAGRPVGQPCDRHPGAVSGGSSGARNRLGPGRTHRCGWFSQQQSLQYQGRQQLAGAIRQRVGE